MNISVTSRENTRLKRRLKILPKQKQLKILRHPISTEHSVFLVGAFSLKEKSPTITVGSFFSVHSEWSTFLSICSTF